MSPGGDGAFVYLPGTLILGKDSHAPSYGAFSAFGAGIGVTEMGCAIATGRLWLKVPESIKVVITGKLKKGVYVKDIALMAMKIVRRMVPLTAQLNSLAMP